MARQPRLISCGAAIACLHIVGHTVPAFSQERVPIDIEPIEQSAEPTTFDVLDRSATKEPASEVDVQECRDQQDAGTISGEIIVCRELTVDNSNRLVADSDARLKDYARRTAFANDPRTPDVAGPGIFRGPATVSGLCLLGPCPPPPAITVDFAALDEAPVGSDAHRIGQGLPALGRSDDLSPETRRLLEAELGLPPSTVEIINEVNSAGSEEPTEEP